MTKEYETNATVNENVDDKIVNKEQATEVEKTKDLVTWKAGPISLNLNPKVAKGLKFVGIGVATVGAAVLGIKFGGFRIGEKKDMIIRNQAAEISKLKALMESAPEVIETATDVVAEAAEVVPEVVTEVVSEG